MSLQDQKEPWYDKGIGAIPFIAIIIVIVVIAAALYSWLH